MRLIIFSFAFFSVILLSSCSKKNNSQNNDLQPVSNKYITTDDEDSQISQIKREAGNVITEDNSNSKIEEYPDIEVLSEDTIISDDKYEEFKKIKGISNPEELYDSLEKLLILKNIKINEIKDIGTLDLEIVKNLRNPCPNILETKDLNQLNESISNEFKFTKNILQFHLSEISKVKYFKKKFISTIQQNLSLKDDDSLEYIIEELIKISDLPQDIEDYIKDYKVNLENITTEDELNNLLIFLIERILNYQNIDYSLIKIEEILNNASNLFQKVKDDFKHKLYLRKIVKTLTKSEIISEYQLMARTNSEMYYTFMESIEHLNNVDLNKLSSIINSIEDISIKIQLNNIIKEKKEFNYKLNEATSKIPKQTKGPGGITNLSRTCYINSIMHILSKDPEMFYAFEVNYDWTRKKYTRFLNLKPSQFPMYTIEQKDALSFKNKTNYKQLKIFTGRGKKIIENIYKGKNTNKKNAKSFYKSLQDIGWKQKLTTQNDSLEVLDFIVNHLPRSNNMSNKAIFKYENWIGENMITTLEDIFISNPLTINDDIPFEEVINENIKPIEEEAKKTRMINGIIRKVTSCSNKKFNYNNLPKTMVFALGRSGDKKDTKIKSLIKISEILAIRPEWTMNNPKGESVKYQLLALNIHKGKDLKKGHYISYVKNNNHWYQISDSQVTPISTSIDKINEISKNAYILIFKAISE